jgi:hypothetical protein
VAAVELDAAPVWLAALWLDCPGCGHGWHETRKRGQPVVRIWDPAEVPGAARHD